ncbi:MAG: hypothetical protein J1F13_05635 [Prevotellaceae bacterium]|nr:hypothetical protein [Prevotellaceae bacterium]
MMTTETLSAIDLIRNPEMLNRNTIPVLREAIRQNPFHQTLYLLLLQNLYKVHDPQFGSALKQFAPMVADRAVLFDMVEGMNYHIPLQKLDGEAIVADGDRTLLLIDNFLKGLPDNSDGKIAKADAPDPQVDYSAYLEQLPDYDSEPAQDNSTNAHDEAINALDNFGEEDEFTVSAIRKNLAEADDLPIVDDTSEDAQNEEFYTETMAGIYIKQQKFAQALEIIKVISAANPKKSVYFAEQIRYLELLKRITERKKQ